MYTVRLCYLVLLALCVSGDTDTEGAEGTDTPVVVIDSADLMTLVPKEGVRYSINWGDTEADQEMKAVADRLDRERWIVKENGEREVESKDIYSESGTEDEEIPEVKLKRSHRTAPTAGDEEEEHLALLDRENKNSHHPDRQAEEGTDTKTTKSEGGTADDSDGSDSGESESADSTDGTTTDATSTTRLPTKKRIYGLKTILLKYFILPIKKTLTFLFKEDSDTHYVMKKNDGSKRSNSKEEKVYNCPTTNVTVNSSISYIIEDDLISNMNLSGGCGAVLFYSMYCPFSIALIPHYRALTRVYPSLKLFAVEINAYSSSCLQFGAVGTPTVVLFLNSRPVKKVPGTSRNITSIASFISNITDLQPLAPLELVPSDGDGVQVKEHVDYMLLTSLLFLITSALYHLSITTTGTALLTRCYNIVCKPKTD